MSIQRFDLADGATLVYDPAFLSRPRADALLERLVVETPWRQERGPFGHPLPRLTAYHADPGVAYRYSGITHEPLPWPEDLLALRRLVEQVAAAPFNSLLLNYYRDGKDRIGWHADDEPELGPDPIVPSVSLGASRRFVLRHRRSGERCELLLEHGSLLIMGGTCQRHWLHALPRTAQEVSGRINLTFRHIHRSG